MKQAFLVLLLFQVMIIPVSLAQKSQTLTLKGEQILLEEAADSSLIYLFPGMESARVTLTNGETFSANINYNILADEMKTQARRGIQTIDPRQVVLVEVAGSFFTYHQGEGYVEIKYEGKFPLFQKRRIQISAIPLVRGPYQTKDRTSSIDQATYIQTGPSGQLYLLNRSDGELEVTLRFNEYFLIGKGETLVKVTNQRQLLRDFPENRRELRDYLRRENTDLSKPEDLLKLVKFLETLP